MTTSELAVCRKLAATADAAWELIEQFGGLDQWFPAVVSCELAGTGEGARRTMTLQGGLGTIVDEVVAVDPARRTLTYNRLESPFPVSSYVGTVEVFESFDGRAVVVWSVDFESDPDEGVAVRELLSSGIGDGIEGLDLYCGR